MKGNIYKILANLLVVSLIIPLVGGVLSFNAASKNVYFIKEIGFISSFDGCATPNEYSNHSLSEQDNYTLCDADNRASSNYIYCIEPGYI